MMTVWYGSKFIIGTAIAAYKLVPGSPRIKTTAAFSTLGVTVLTTVFTLAVENPNGFNRLMYSRIEYQKSGTWPAVPAEVRNQTVESKFATYSNSTVSEYGKTVDVKTLINPDVKTDLTGNDSLTDIFKNLSLDSLFKDFLSFFKLSTLEGYFDELYGFIWFSQVLLMIICISLLFLIIIYIFINILLLNKEAIINRFNNKNKVLNLYIKYQIILGHISFYLLPILIISGLVELIYILYYLITHPLPIQELNMDTHIWITKSK